MHNHLATSEVDTGRYKLDCESTLVSDMVWSLSARIMTTPRTSRQQVVVQPRASYLLFAVVTTSASELRHQCLLWAMVVETSHKHIPPDVVAIPFHDQALIVHGRQNRGSMTGSVNPGGVGAKGEQTPPLREVVCPCSYGLFLAGSYNQVHRRSFHSSHAYEPLPHLLVHGAALLHISNGNSLSAWQLWQVNCGDMTGIGGINVDITRMLAVDEGPWSGPKDAPLFQIIAFKIRERE